MTTYAKIITDDKRFERMLSLELKKFGVEFPSFEKAPEDMTRDNLYTIVDLDYYFEYDISELFERSRVICFSTADEPIDTKISGKCYAFLHRPFLMSEFISIILSDNGKGNYIADQKRFVAKKMQLGDRKKHPQVAIESKCAVYGNERISLTETEHKVLTLLCQKRGEAVSRAEICAMLGADGSNMCDVYICMLRRKLDNKLGLKLIHTVRGRGYMVK